MLLSENKYDDDDEFRSVEWFARTAELDMDWIHPWIGLNWIGSDQKFCPLHCFFTENGSALV